MSRFITITQTCLDSLPSHSHVQTTMTESCLSSLPQHNHVHLPAKSLHCCNVIVIQLEFPQVLPNKMGTECNSGVCALQQNNLFNQELNNPLSVPHSKGKHTTPQDLLRLVQKLRQHSTSCTAAPAAALRDWPLQPEEQSGNHWRPGKSKAN